MSSEKLKQKSNKVTKVKKFKGTGLRIFDDSEEFGFGAIKDKKKLLLLEAASDDEEDELPVFAGVTDERPPEVQAMEEFKMQNKWKKVTAPEDDTIESQGKSNKKSRSRSSSIPRKKHGSDLSPVRNKRNISSTPSPPRRNRRNSPSPPRRNLRNSPVPPRRNTRNSPSPPWRNRRNSPSPPRRNRRNSPSPPRSNRRNSPSPPRRNPRNSPSPPRRNSRNSSSPPRRNRKNSPSPPRRNPRNSPPPRRSRRNSPSPARFNRRNSPSPAKLNRRNSPPPPRRDGRRYSPPVSISINSPSPRRNRDRENTSSIPRSSKTNGSKLGEKNDTKLDKTLDGKSAGLQKASALRGEMIEHRDREHRFFETLDDSISGRNAKTIQRDRKTGQKRDMEAEAKVNAEEQKLAKERKEQYDKWGKGLKQVEQHEDRIATTLHEMAKPLARYKDDEDLDGYLKKQERDGDPMLKFLAKGNQNLGKPSYGGPPPLPNRYQIPPGYRWDGVDRSNGYEKEWFSKINSRKALNEESYKWSVEDL